MQTLPINQIKSSNSPFHKDITISPIEDQKPIPFVIFENNKFVIPQEARTLLSKETSKNIGIISLVGKYRTGKSFLLNRVLLNREQSPGFGVGPTIKPCTKGIWIWSHPLIISNSHCKEPFPCFLIDTEGLGAYDEEVNHDSKVFLIAILISSLFIYNSFGTIDENAINSLSFVLNLSKTIKLRNNSINDNESELAEYFPSLYWLLRDFSLKLEDHDGNVITEKQYLEYALQQIKGSSEIIEEKNKVRSLIRTYFPERDCFVMVRPVEKESDLQNMSKLPDSHLRKEFIEQAKMFKNKVMKKTKPKIFMKKNLTGEMLVELVQSILNAINGGNIPVIENSWKYVIQAECIKRSNNSLTNFHNELNSYRQNNMNNPFYVKNIDNYTKELADKYMDDFLKNGLFDEESKNEFGKKLRAKLNEEINKFNKENENIFEEKFINDLNDKAKKFMFDIDRNDKYNNTNNYNIFFNDLELFKNEAEELTPEFPHKKEILFDKLMVIIRKFIDTYFSKVNRIKNDYEQKIKNFQDKLKEQKDNISILQDEIALLKTQNETLKEENLQKQQNENMNNILNYIQEGIKLQNQETKSMLEQLIINQREKEIRASKDKELLNNYKETTLKNQELAMSLAETESKLKTYEDQINNLQKYKDLFQNAMMIKCKHCSKHFTLDVFKTHFENCKLNLRHNNNMQSINIDKLKIKILKGTVKKDEVGKVYLEYIIDIWYNSQNWRICKRFNQFAVLYKTLKSVFRGVVDMPESSNIFVNINGVGKGSCSFHENKLRELERFIKDLAEIEVVNKSKQFRKFLEFERFVDEEQEVEEVKQQKRIENARYKGSGINVKNDDNNNNNYGTGIRNVMISSIKPKLRKSSMGDDGLFDDDLD